MKLHLPSGLRKALLACLAALAAHSVPFTVATGSALVSSGALVSFLLGQQAIASDEDGEDDEEEETLPLTFTGPEEVEWGESATTWTGDNGGDTMTLSGTNVWVDISNNNDGGNSAKFATNGTIENLRISINGTVPSGMPQVGLSGTLAAKNIWFTGTNGRARVTSANLFSNVENIYVNSVQLWFDSNINFGETNFFIGSSVYEEGINSLDHSALRFRSTVSTGGGLTLLENSGIALQGGNTFTVNGLVSGGDYILAVDSYNAGNLSLLGGGSLGGFSFCGGGADSHRGTTTVRLGGAFALTGETNIRDKGALVLNSGCVLTLTGSITGVAGGSLTNQGTLSLDGGTLTLTGTYNSLGAISGSGNIVLNASTTASTDPYTYTISSLNMTGGSLTVYGDGRNVGGVYNSNILVLANGGTVNELKVGWGTEINLGADLIVKGALGTGGNRAKFTKIGDSEEPVYLVLDGTGGAKTFSSWIYELDGVDVKIVNTSSTNKVTISANNATISGNLYFADTDAAGLSIESSTLTITGKLTAEGNFNHYGQGGPDGAEKTLVLESGGIIKGNLSTGYHSNILLGDDLEVGGFSRSAGSNNIGYMSVFNRTTAAAEAGKTVYVCRIIGEDVQSSWADFYNSILGSAITYRDHAEVFNEGVGIGKSGSAKLTLTAGGSIDESFKVKAGLVELAENSGTYSFSDLNIASGAELSVKSGASIDGTSGISLNGTLSVANASTAFESGARQITMGSDGVLKVKGGTLVLADSGLSLSMTKGASILLSEDAHLSLSGVANAINNFKIKFDFDLMAIENASYQLFENDSDIADWFESNWSKYIDLSKYEQGCQFSFVDGVLSWSEFRVENANIKWHGTDLTWVVGVLGWEENQTFISGDTVTFGDDDPATSTDTGTITLGGNITTGGMTVAGDYEFILDGHTLTINSLTVNAGATMTFGNSTGTLTFANGGDLTLNGTLVLKAVSDARLAGIIWGGNNIPTITAGDNACIVLDFSGAVRGDTRPALSTFVGTSYNKRIELKGTMFKHDSTSSQTFSEIVVHKGTQLFLSNGGTYTGNISIAGMTTEGRQNDNAGDDYHDQGHAQEGALRLAATLSGNLTLMDDAAITMHSGDGASRAISGTVSSSAGNRFALYKHGSNTLELSGTVQNIAGIYSRNYNRCEEGGNHSNAGNGGNVTLSGSLDVGISTDTFVFSIENADNNITLNGSMSGGATINKLGAGKLVLAGNLNSYSGALDIDAGTVELNYTLDTNTDVATTQKFSSVDLAANTTLSLGKSVAIGNLVGSSAGTINAMSNVTGAILTVNQSTNATASTAFSGIGLTKAGNGTLTLTGTYNGGAVSVQKGTLTMTGSTITIGGNVEVATGAKLNLTGAGGTVTLQSGLSLIGDIQVGDWNGASANKVGVSVQNAISGSGNIHLHRGTLTLKSGGTITGRMDLRDEAALVLGGDLTIGGFEIDLNGDTGWKSDNAKDSINWYQTISRVEGKTEDVTLTLNVTSESSYSKSTGEKLALGEGIHLVKKGAQTQLITGLKADKVSIEEGALRLTVCNWDTQVDRAFWISDLTVTKGTSATNAGVLELYKDSWNTNGKMNITLSKGGKVQWNSSQTADIGSFNFGKLTLGGTAQTDWENAEYDGVFNFNTQANNKTRTVKFSQLTGTGKLNVGTLQGTSLTDHYQWLEFSEINNFNGWVDGSYGNNGNTNGTQYGRVIIGHVHQDQNFSANLNINGGVISTDFQKSGAGALTLTSLRVLTSEGKLYMNYEGTLKITNGVTLDAGVHLNYTTGVADNTISLAYSMLKEVMDSQTGTKNRFILDFDTSLEEALESEEGICLGISGAVQDDLETLKEYFGFGAVAPADDWRLFIGSDSLVYISTSEITVTESNWDKAWKVSGGPVRMREITKSYGATEDNSNYGHVWQLGITAETDVDIDYTGQIYLADGSGGANAVVLGGVYYDDPEAIGTLNGQSSWILAAGGTYHIIAGGSSCFAFNDDAEEDEAAGGFIGNSHIQLKGGTVDYIVGGNHINNSAFTFQGNSYISVMEGTTVNGGIVGGSTLTKGSNNTDVYAFNGDSHIFIYTVLSNPVDEADKKGIWDGTASAGTGNDGLNDDGTQNMHGAAFTAIVGGNAWIDRAEDSVGTQMTPTFYGDTHITIDLSNNSKTGSFDKDIVGGNYTATVLGDTTRSTRFIGSTNISIHGSYEYEYGEYTMRTSVWFDGAINGASRRASNGGGETYFNGSTNIEITDGTFRNAIAGGFYFEDTADGNHIANLEAATTVTLNSGSFWRVVGGSYSLAGGTSSKENQEGNSKVVIKGGTFTGNTTATEEQQKMSFVAGGSFFRNNAGINSHSGNTVVEISGGLFGYVDYGFDYIDESDTVHIVGGDYVNFNGKDGASPTSTITGSTSVSISEDDNTTSIIGIVVGGTYATDIGTGGSATISDTSRVTISGGTITPELGGNATTSHNHNGIAIVAGSMLVDEGDTIGSHILSTANTAVEVSGGTINGHIVGGHYATDARGGTNELTISGTTTITLTGGTIGSSTVKSNIIGGHFSANTSSPDELNLGTVNITVGGATIYGDIIGGSWREAANALEQEVGEKQNKGAVTITLTSGTLDGDVWAAGYHKTNAALTAYTESTEVKIGSGFVFTTKENNLTHTVSGWYGFGYTGVTSKDLSTVDSAKLTFDDDATYGDFSNVTFEDFSEISVKSATVDLSDNTFSTVFGTITKSGNGTLTLGELVYKKAADNTNDLNFTVSGGSAVLTVVTALADVSTAANSSLVITGGSSEDGASSVSGTLSGAGGTLQVGNGTSAAGMLNFTGNVSVASGNAAGIALNNGTLNLAKSSSTDATTHTLGTLALTDSNNTLDVQSGTWKLAAVSGDGSLSSLKLAGTLEFGAGSTPNQLSLANLVLSDGATLKIGSLNSTKALFNFTGNGGYTLQNELAVDLSGWDWSEILEDRDEEYSFALFSNLSIADSASAWDDLLKVNTGSSLPDGWKLTYDNGVLKFSVDYTNELLWIGGTNTWSFNDTDAEWTNNGRSATFTDHHIPTANGEDAPKINVRFGSYEGTQPTITLEGNINVHNMAVDASYTFSGNSGSSLTINGDLSIAASSVLTLTGADVTVKGAFSGGTGANTTLKTQGVALQNSTLTLEKGGAVAMLQFAGFTGDGTGSTNNSTVKIGDNLIIGMLLGSNDGTNTLHFKHTGDLDSANDKEITEAKMLTVTVNGCEAIPKTRLDFGEGLNVKWTYKPGSSIQGGGYIQTKGDLTFSFTGNYEIGVNNTNTGSLNIGRDFTIDNTSLFTINAGSRVDVARNFSTRGKVAINGTVTIGGTASFGSGEALDLMGTAALTLKGNQKTTIADTWIQDTPTVTIGGDLEFTTLRGANGTITFNRYADTTKEGNVEVTINKFGNNSGGSVPSCNMTFNAGVDLHLKTGFNGWYAKNISLDGGSFTYDMDGTNAMNLRIGAGSLTINAADINPETGNAKNTVNINAVMIVNDSAARFTVGNGVVTNLKKGVIFSAANGTVTLGGELKASAANFYLAGANTNVELKKGGSIGTLKSATLATNDSSDSPNESAATGGNLKLSGGTLTIGSSTSTLTKLEVANATLKFGKGVGQNSAIGTNKITLTTLALSGNAKLAIDSTGLAAVVEGSTADALFAFDGTGKALTGSSLGIDLAEWTGLSAALGSDDSYEFALFSGLDSYEDLEVSFFSGENAFSKAGWSVEFDDETGNIVFSRVSTELIWEKRDSLTWGINDTEWTSGGTFTEDPRCAVIFDTDKNGEYGEEEVQVAFDFESGNNDDTMNVDSITFKSGNHHFTNGKISSLGAIIVEAGAQVFDATSVTAGSSLTSGSGLVIGVDSTHTASVEVTNVSGKSFNFGGITVNAGSEFIISGAGNDGQYTSATNVGTATVWGASGTDNHVWGAGTLVLKDLDEFATGVAATKGLLWFLLKKDESANDFQLGALKLTGSTTLKVNGALRPDGGEFTNIHILDHVTDIYVEDEACLNLADQAAFERGQYNNVLHLGGLGNSTSTNNSNPLHLTSTIDNTVTVRWGIKMEGDAKVQVTGGNNAKLLLIGEFNGNNNTLTKLGDNTLELGSNANGAFSTTATSSGKFAVQAGTLALNFGSGEKDDLAGYSVELSSSGILSVTSGATYTLSSLTDTTDLTKLNNANSAASTNISNGGLKLSGTNSTGQLTLGGTNTNGALTLTTTGTTVTANGITGTAGSITGTVDGTSRSSLVIDFVKTMTTGATPTEVVDTFNGSISNVNLTKKNTGTQNLAGNFNGGTITVNGGTLGFTGSASTITAATMEIGTATADAESAPTVTSIVKVDTTGAKNFTNGITIHKDAKLLITTADGWTTGAARGAGSLVMKDIRLDANNTDFTKFYTLLGETAENGTPGLASLELENTLLRVANSSDNDAKRLRSVKDIYVHSGSTLEIVSNNSMSVGSGTTLHLEGAGYAGKEALKGAALAFGINGTNNNSYPVTAGLSVDADSIIGVWSNTSARKVTFTGALSSENHMLTLMSGDTRTNNVEFNSGFSATGSGNIEVLSRIHLKLNYAKAHSADLSNYGIVMGGGDLDLGTTSTDGYTIDHLADSTATTTAADTTIGRSTGGTVTSSSSTLTIDYSNTQAAATTSASFTGGNISLAKKGVGTQVITGSFTGKNVDVTAGTLTLGGGVTAADINVANAALNLGYSVTADSLTLNAATVALTNTTATTEAMIGKLDIAGGTSSLALSSGDVAQKVSFTTVTGGGALNLRGLTGTQTKRSVHMESITDLDGSITADHTDVNNKLYLGTIDQAEGVSGSIAVTDGDLYSGTFKKLGAGEITLGSKLHVENMLYMNYNGEVNWGADGTGAQDIQLADNGVTLGYMYSRVSTDNYGMFKFAAEEIEGYDYKENRLWVDIWEVNKSELELTGVDLGITYSNGKSEEEWISYFEKLIHLRDAEQVGLDGIVRMPDIELSWQEVGSEKHLFLKASGLQRSRVLWDDRWSNELADAPAESEMELFKVGEDRMNELINNDAAASFTDNVIELGHNDTFEHANDSYIRLTVGSDKPYATVVGGRVWANGDSDGLTEEELWHHGDSFISYVPGADDASMHLLVGGSSMVDYASDSATAETRVGGFDGDSHIQMDGGSVDYIVGGNHVNNQAFTFDGDSYISVFNGNVRGGIVGGSTITKGADKSVDANFYAFNGTTHLFIYSTLSNEVMRDATPGISDGSAEGGAAFTAVVGGNAWIGLPDGTSRSAMNPTFNGSTYVTIDLVGEQSKGGNKADTDGSTPGANETFDKAIVGGNYTARKDASEADFRTTFRGGDAHIDITADAEVNTFTAGINGASRRASAGSGSTIFDGNTYVDIAGGKYEEAIAGGFWFEEGAAGNHVATLTGNTNVTINDGAFWRVAGGSYSLGGDVESHETQVGSSVVTIIDGEFNSDNGSNGTGQKDLGFVAGGDFYRDNAGDSHERIAGTAADGTQLGADTTLDIQGGTFTNMHIVGGDYANFGVTPNAAGQDYTGPKTSIAGTSSVNISEEAGKKVNITGMVVGGSYLTDEGADGTIEVGATSISITGGTIGYEQTGHQHGQVAVVAGNVIIDEDGAETGNHTATVTGSTSLAISGGSITGDVVGGSLVTGVSGQNTLSVGSTSIELTGGSVSGTVYGGHYSMNTASPDVLELGDVKITVDGAALNNLVGGSYRAATNGLAAGTQEKGDIVIELTSGSLSGNLYAAGYHAGEVLGANKLNAVTKSTSVTVGEGFEFTGTSQIVSGAYYKADTAGKDTSSVTTSSLTFAATSAQTLTQVSVREFDTIRTAADVAVGSLYAAGGNKLTKQGAGDLLSAGALLSAAGGAFDGTLAIEGGSVELGAASSLSALELALETTARTEATAYLRGTGLTAAGGAIALTLNGIEDLTNGTYYLATGLADELTLENFTGWSDALASLNAKLYMEMELIVANNALILRTAINDKSEWFWTGADDHVWAEGSAANWSVTGANDHRERYFDTTVTGEDGDVYLSGTVSVGDIYVRAGSYVYTLKSGKGGIQMDAGATLYVGGYGATANAELALENTSIPSVELGELGTLTLSHDKAVGDSTVITFAGGTLAWSEADGKLLTKKGLAHAKVADSAIVDVQVGDKAGAAVADGVTLGGAAAAAEAGSALEGALSNGLRKDGRFGLTVEWKEDSNREATGSIELLGGSLTYKVHGAGTVTLAGGISLADGTALNLQTDGSLKVDSAFTNSSGSATVEIGSAESKGLYELAADNSGYAGTIRLVGDGAAGTVATLSAAHAAGGASTTLALAGRGIVATDAAAAEIAVKELAVLTGTSYIGGTTADGANKSIRLTAKTITGNGTLANAKGGFAHVLTGDLSAFTGTIQAGAGSSWTLAGDLHGAQELSTRLAGEGSIIVAYENAAKTGLELSSKLSGRLSLENAMSGTTLILTNGANDSTGALVTHDNMIQLGTAEKAAVWAGTTLRNVGSGTGTLTLVNGTLRNPLAAGHEGVSVQVDAQGVVDMGGTKSAEISDIVVHGNLGGHLTNVAGGITAGGENGVRVRLIFGTEHLGTSAAEAEKYLVSNAGDLTAEELGKDALELDFSNKAFWTLLLKHREENYKSWLHVIHGGELVYDRTAGVDALLGDGDGSSYGDLLRCVGFNLVEQKSGDLVLAGTSKDVYLVLNPYEYEGVIDDPDAATRPHEVDEYGVLSGYKATVIDEGETLTVTAGELPAQRRDADENVLRDVANGGLTVNNLVGLEGSTFHGKRAEGVSDDVTIVLNNTQITGEIDRTGIDHAGNLGVEDVRGQDTIFDGTIVGDEGVNFAKTGKGMLTVGHAQSHTGGIQIAGDLELREGGLTLQGDKDSHAGNLVFAYGEGEAVVNNGLTVTEGGVLTVNGGLVEQVSGNGSNISLTKKGQLVLKGDSSVSGSSIMGDGTGSLTVKQGASLSMGAGGVQADENGDKNVISDVEVAVEGALTVRGGGVADSDVTVTESGSFELRDHASMSDSDLAVAQGGKAKVDNGASVAGSGEITVDGSLTVQGGGSIELGEDGDITINGSEGTLTVQDGAAGSHIATEGNLTLGEGGTLDLGQSKGNAVGGFAGSGSLLGGSGSELTVNGKGNTFSGRMDGTTTDGPGGRKTGGGTLIVESGADLTLDGIKTNKDYMWNADVEGGGSLTVDVTTGSSNVYLDVTLEEKANFEYRFDTGNDVRLNGTLTVNGPVGNVTFYSDGAAPTDDVYLGDLNFSGNLSDLKKGFHLDGMAFEHYTGDIFDEHGQLKLTFTKQEANPYLAPGMEKNARAGAVLFYDVSDPDRASYEYMNANPEGDLYKIHSTIFSKASAQEDVSKPLAALAGASISVLGSAVSEDIQRQLNTIRNRTSMMNDTHVNADGGEPAFHMWLNAESGYHKLDAEGLAPGFTLNGWGGTVGVDAELRHNVSVGLALTAMYNDLKTSSADNGCGDLDATYLSAFARTSRGAWTHTFVASAGLLDVSLNRTVSADVWGGMLGAHSYQTHGDTDGYAIGAMYEVGYTCLLNERGSVAVQPVANIQFRHAAINGYTERNSDAGLRVNGITHDVLTVGLGARVQSLLGENVFNRSSIFEARALVKSDFGDRSGTATNALIHGAKAAEVESANVGAVGIELGAGLSVPIGSRGGSVFIDGAVEFRSNYTTTNASVGYRISF